jgi:hypothetical protein
MGERQAGIGTGGSSAEWTARARARLSGHRTTASGTGWNQCLALDPTRGRNGIAG